MLIEDINYSSKNSNKKYFKRSERTLISCQTNLIWSKCTYLEFKTEKREKDYKVLEKMINLLSSFKKKHKLKDVKKIRESEAK